MLKNQEKTLNKKMLDKIWFDDESWLKNLDILRIKMSIIHQISVRQKQFFPQIT